MPYVIGVAVALSVWVFARTTSMDHQRSFYPVVLVATASYYVLFAILSTSPRAQVVEVLLMLPFVVAAGLGYRRNLWLVVAALLGHGGLDIVHAGVVANSGVPPWWTAFCLSFDVVAAGMLAVLLVPGRRGRAALGVSLERS